MAIAICEQMAQRTSKHQVIEWYIARNCDKTHVIMCVNTMNQQQLTGSAQELMHSQTLFLMQYKVVLTIQCCYLSSIPHQLRIVIYCACPSVAK